MRLPLLQSAQDLIRWANELVRVVEINQQQTQRQKFGRGDILALPSYTVATVPAATPEAQLIYVSNEIGGAVVAFSDGANWRRVTDRAVIS